MVTRNTCKCKIVNKCLESHAKLLCYFSVFSNLSRQQKCEIQENLCNFVILRWLGCMIDKFGGFLDDFV